MIPQDFDQFGSTAVKAVSGASSKEPTPTGEKPVEGDQKPPRRGRKAGRVYTVEYIIQGPDGLRGKVTQTMGQMGLANLLNSDGVNLIAVNRETSPYFPKKRHK